MILHKKFIRFQFILGKLAPRQWYKICTFSKKIMIDKLKKYSKIIQQLL